MEEHQSMVLHNQQALQQALQQLLETVNENLVEVLGAVFEKVSEVQFRRNFDRDQFPEVRGQVSGFKNFLSDSRTELHWNSGLFYSNSDRIIRF